MVLAEHPYVRHSQELYWLNSLCKSYTPVIGRTKKGLRTFLFDSYFTPLKYTIPYGPKHLKVLLNQSAKVTSTEK